MSPILETLPPLVRGDTFSKYGDTTTVSPRYWRATVSYLGDTVSTILGDTSMRIPPTVSYLGEILSLQFWETPRGEFHLLCVCMYESEIGTDCPPPPLPLLHPIIAVHLRADFRYFLSSKMERRSSRYKRGLVSGPARCAMGVGKV